VLKVVCGIYQNTGVQPLSQGVLESEIVLSREKHIPWQSFSNQNSGNITPIALSDLVYLIGVKDTGFVIAQSSTYCLSNVHFATSRVSLP
jgi:hypothetical protein